MSPCTFIDTFAIETRSLGIRLDGASRAPPSQRRFSQLGGRTFLLAMDMCVAVQDEGACGARNGQGWHLLAVAANVRGSSGMMEPRRARTNRCVPCVVSLDGDIVVVLLYHERMSIGGAKHEDVRGGEKHRLRVYRACISSPFFPSPPVRCTACLPLFVSNCVYVC